MAALGEVCPVWFSPAPFQYAGPPHRGPGPQTRPSPCSPVICRCRPPRPASRKLGAGGSHLAASARRSRHSCTQRPESASAATPPSGSGPCQALGRCGLLAGGCHGKERGVGHGVAIDLTGRGELGAGAHERSLAGRLKRHINAGGVVVTGLAGMSALFSAWLTRQRQLNKASAPGRWAARRPRRHAGLRLDDEARGLVAARGTRDCDWASRTSPRASRRPRPSQRPAAPPRTPASPRRATLARAGHRARSSKSRPVEEPQRARAGLRAEASGSHDGRDTARQEASAAPV